jgi:hypothetical protein
MTRPVREELNPYIEQLCELRYRAVRDIEGNPNFAIWSFAVINDLRARESNSE